MKRTLLSALKHSSGILLTIFALLCSCQVWAAWNWTADKVIYFVNKTGSSWGSVAHLRVGKDGDNNNYNEQYDMSLVPGTESYYQYTIPSWNGYDAYGIGNNAGYTGNNSIYSMGGGNYFISKHSLFVHENVSEDKTIIIKEVNDTKSGTTYYKNTDSEAMVQSGQVKYTVNITQPANGTITISCSNESNITTVTANTEYQVLPTTILTIIVTPNTGYYGGSLSVSGSYHMSGTNYVIDGDVTLSATVSACTAPTVGSVIVTGDISTPQCVGVVSLDIPSPTGGVTPYTYQWFKNTTASTSEGTAVTAKASTSTYIPEEVGTYFYYCTVYSSNICPSSYNASSNTTGSIGVLATPILSASETSVTNSVPVTITATDAGIPDNGWVITKDGVDQYGYLYKETTTSTMFKGNVGNSDTPVTYTVTGTASSGCSSSVEVTVSQDGDICQ